MFRRLHETIAEIDDLDFESQTLLLNDRMGDCLRSCGLGALAVVGHEQVVINVHGRLRAESDDVPSGVEPGRFTLSVDFRAFAVEGDGYAQLEELLRQFEMDGVGAYVWIVPDGYLAGLSAVEEVWAAEGGGYFSHESICVLNTGDRPTRCRLEVFYEDLARAEACTEFEVGARRSVHHRLDKLMDAGGEPFIAKDAPVSYRLTSVDSRVVVQTSRILTSGRGSEFASFGTSMAWAPIG